MIIVDETLSGERLSSLIIEGLSERMTVREIIRARIWQEVQDHNAMPKKQTFSGLVKPLEDAAALLGLGKVRKPVDWEKQYEIALRAFEKNGFFMLVGDRQAESLDEEFHVGPETEVSFVKLTPLVGG